MNKRQLQYSIYLILGLVILASVIFQGVDNAVFFYTPEEIIKTPDDFIGRPIRVGGVVRPGSVTWDAERVLLTFAVTEGAQDLSIRFVGTRPDLFREGQGVVAEGRLHVDGVLRAERLLVKHSEEYQADAAWHADRKRVYQSLLGK